MYIFELIAQLFKKKNYKARFEYNPQNTTPDEEQIKEQEENCNHMFLPLDSSNTLFACKYCGLILPKEKLKDVNIFRNNK